MGIIYRLVSHSDNLLGQVELLYTSAFPADERRDFSEFVALLKDESVPFSVMCACDGDDENRMLAFITFWNFGKVDYLEHFAVIPQMRGKGIGHEVFCHFLGDVASDIVLEVEPPTTPIAERCVKFYESMGLKLWNGFHYVQPPYGDGKCALEMKLMTHGNVTPQILEETVEMMRVNVYGCSLRSTK